MIFYSSDHHFGHANIIKYCHRPYQSVHEMNADLVQRWNHRVKKTDTVYYLGDFGMGSVGFLQPILDQLNGEKHLIWGNHDKNTKKLNGWASMQPYLEIYEGKQMIVLMHYSMRVWRNSHRAAIQLYGHSHGNLPGNSQQTDVGVDCWEMTPVTLDQIMNRLKSSPPFKSQDHHQAEA